MSTGMDILKSAIVQFYQKYPNTSPLYVIETLESHFDLEPGTVAALISILRESEGKLVVSGQDENGVLLSAA